MLQQITKDCQHFVSVHQDSKDIEESGVSHKKYTTKHKTSHQLNQVNQRKNKVFFRLNNALAAASCIGIRTAHIQT